MPKVEAVIFESQLIVKKTSFICAERLPRIIEVINVDILATIFIIGRIDEAEISMPIIVDVIDVEGLRFGDDIETFPADIPFRIRGE